MKSYQSALFVVVLFTITTINAKGKNGGKAKRKSKSKSKSKSKGRKWDESWSKSKSHSSSSEMFDWPCEPFSTAVTEEPDFESTDISTTSSWSKPKNTKWAKRHNRKSRHRKRPCKMWDISSTIDISTTDDESADRSTTDFIDGLHTTETTDSMDFSDTGSTESAVESTFPIDCESYGEGCSTTAGTQTQFVPAGVCCVHHQLAMCVGCDEPNLCDQSNPDIVCECYEEADCPTSCGTRCIGLSQALVRNDLSAPQAGALKTESDNENGTYIEPKYMIGVVVALCVVVLVCVVAAVRWVCKKAQSGKYRSMTVEDQSVDMNAVNVVTETAIAEANGEESTSEDIVLPAASESRTNTMKSVNDDIALTAWIGNGNEQSNIR